MMSFNKLLSKILTVLLIARTEYGSAAACRKYLKVAPTLVSQGFESLGQLNSFNNKKALQKTILTLTEISKSGTLEINFSDKEVSMEIYAKNSPIAESNQFLHQSAQGIESQKFLEKVAREIESKVSKKYGRSLKLGFIEVRWQDVGESMYDPIRHPRDEGVYKFHIDGGFMMASVVGEGVATDFQYKDFYYTPDVGEVVLFTARDGANAGFGKPGIHRAIFENLPTRRLFLRASFFPK